MKILDVDFKKKRLNFTYDNGEKTTSENKIERNQKVLKLNETLIKSMDIINTIEDDDREFKEYCARVFRKIIEDLARR